MQIPGKLIVGIIFTIFLMVILFVVFNMVDKGWIM